jgi:hypothetical protein
MTDRSLGYSIKGALWRLPLGLRDRVLNRVYRSREKRFLVVRHPAKKACFYDIILRWVAEHVPELRGCFELRLLPYRLPEDAEYCLHIPWLQDPLEEWSPVAYRQACQLARQCDEQGTPVVNRADRLSNATKSVCAQRLSAAGIRTPRVRLIENLDEFRRTRLGLKLPLIVREDMGHGGPMLRADSEDDLQRLRIDQLRRPITVELIDVRSPQDGLFRKYRYLVAGSLGVPHHMQVANHWITRGTIRVHTPEVDEEEIAFISRPSPLAELFQRARQALGLDVVAFDYGFDRRGRMVIWEANPFPHFHIPRGRLSYLRPAMHRSLAAVVHAYLERAGLAIPQRLAENLDSPAVSRTCAAVRAAA